MRRRVINPILSLCVAATLAVAGCGSSGSVSSRAPQAPASTQPSQPTRTVTPSTDTVTLALLAPQSGARKSAVQLGAALAQAARMGLVDLRDRNVDLKIYDTAGDPTTAAQMASKAIGEGADIILGPLFGSATKAVAPIASRAGLKVLSFSTDTSAAGGSVWVTGFLPEMEASRILSYASAQGYPSVGVFYPQTPYGRAALRGAEEASARGRTSLLGAGGFQPGFAGIQTAAGDFAGAAAGSAAVLIATGGNDLKSAGTFMDFYNFDPRVVKFLGLGQWYSGATLKELTLRGGWFPAPDPVRSTQFSERFQSQFGSKPPLLAVLGYDAVQIAGQSVAAARASSGADVFAKELLTRVQGFKGALGAVRLTPDGRNERALAILEVSDRNFVTIDPAPASFAPGF